VSFISALRFLTVVPVPLRQQATKTQIGRSQAYFPLVGLLIGLLLVGLDYVFGLHLPVSLASGLLLVTLVLITGANHLDGFIDTCDGLVGGKTPEQRREIMRDTRVGAFGVVGAVSLLLLKYVSIAGLPDSSRMEALILMPVLGRWAVVCCIFAFPYARPEGLGRAFKDEASWLTVGVASVVALAVAVGFLHLQGLAVMSGVGLVTLALGVLLKQKFGGLTGDTYGAVIEVGEVVSLILVIAIPELTW
jgi:adenosylcobinamide-GDP ribazoletransferase